MEFRVSFLPASIEVEASQVAPVVAEVDPVDVDHGYYVDVVSPR